MVGTKRGIKKDSENHNYPQKERTDPKGPGSFLVLIKVAKDYGGVACEGRVRLQKEEREGFGQVGAEENKTQEKKKEVLPSDHHVNSGPLRERAL